MVKQHHGMGAICSVLKRMLHPARLIREKCVNFAKDDRPDGLLTVREEVRLLKEALCLVFRHEDFEGQELFTCRKHARTLAEGPEHLCFVESAARPAAGAPEGEGGIDIPDDIRLQDGGQHTREDVELLRREGFNIDDDNDPAPENIPANNRESSAPVEETMWGWKGFCHRKSSGFGNRAPRINTLPHDVLGNVSFLAMFLLLLPSTFLQNVVLTSTNERLVRDRKERPVEWGEFIRFLGLWFHMACYVGHSRADFWSQHSVDPFDGAPVRFHAYMTQRRFDAILSCLTFTNKPPPACRDKFHCVRDLIAAFNSNMKDIFFPAWATCLDESMSAWLNKWTCPGFMFVPRKPHPFGNDHHGICCGLSNIMFVIELVEGKDEKERDPNEVTHGKTCALLLRLTSAIHQTDRKGCHS